jgi:hypothetical protein
VIGERWEELIETAARAREQTLRSHPAARTTAAA